jgi:hypothetical protein
MQYDETKNSVCDDNRQESGQRGNLWKVLIHDACDVLFHLSANSPRA